ncbi:hypothetical protein TWF694_005194 [Orbilia ellipsospora]|uniref:Probable glucan endo-1,3-beta-glucosidase eglC n=1 Tax=Orbilia ellipsospora TaxID=2528407 RepID=A0AAV9X100_9PEZI
MLGKSLLLAAIAAISTVSADGEYLGFNYGATKTSGAVKVYADFLEEFQFAQNLTGQPGKFTSARLYTMIQGGPNPNAPSEAFQAAIDTNTKLLLGIWCSAGATVVSNEIIALQNAIKQYGSKFTNLVIGLSVGSEDLYRNSVMGIQSEAGIGAQPADLVNYIGQVKKALAGTALSSVPIGHVDTWTVWVNSTNNPVIQAIDWIGFDAYPYFQSTMSNSITDAPGLFWDAYQQTISATGKEVWITETGWPTNGKTFNLAVPSIANAQTYWNDIGCALFGKYKTWWYLLRDADPQPPTTPEFGIVDANFKPYYDLSCKTAKPVASPVASTATSAAGSTKTGSPNASKTGSTFVVQPSGTGSPSATGSNPAITSPSSAGITVQAAMGLVTLQALVAAFFLL